MNTTTGQDKPDALAAMFGQLRGDMQQLHTPPRVEAALMAAFAKQQKKRRWQDFISRKLAPLMAVSATATVAAVMVMTPAQLPQDASMSAAATLSAESLAYQAAADTPFVALASAEQIANEPSPRVVQADVPRMWLAGAGVPVGPEVAGEAVRAELLVNGNGDALAVRLMP